MNARPQWLTTVCIICLTLGGLGLFSSLWSAGVMLFADRIQEFVQSMQVGRQGSFEADMQSRIETIQARWKVLNYMLVGSHLILAGILFGGSILALKSRPHGRRLLAAACLGLLLLEAVRVVPMIDVTYKQNAVMRELMPKLISGSPAGGGPAPGPRGPAMVQVMEMSMAFGVAMTFGWLAVKVGLYGFSAYYLRRDDVRRYFEPVGDDPGVANAAGPVA